MQNSWVTYTTLILQSKPHALFMKNTAYIRETVFETFVAAWSQRHPNIQRQKLSMFL